MVQGSLRGSPLGGAASSETVRDATRHDLRRQTMILVTGATGMFGGGITRELAERGVPVRAMTSNPERAEQLKRPGVDPVVADMDCPETLGEALAGIDTVFLV